MEDEWQYLDYMAAGQDPIDGTLSPPSARKTKDTVTTEARCMVTTPTEQLSPSDFCASPSTAQANARNDQEPLGDIDTDWNWVETATLNHDSRCYPKDHKPPFVRFTLRCSKFFALLSAHRLAHNLRQSAKRLKTSKASSKCRSMLRQDVSSRPRDQ